MVEPYTAHKTGEAAIWVFLGGNRMWARNQTELTQYGVSSTTQAHTIDASASLWLIPTLGPVP
jgi:hypothetical protein